MNTQNTWIKMSERKPTEADLPVQLYYEDHFQIYNERLPDSEDHDGYTHWKQHRETPPTKEPTRDEQDEQAFQKQFTGKTHGNDLWHFDFTRSQWHAALAYERAALRQIIALYTANDISIQELVKRVKERVG